MCKYCRAEETIFEVLNMSNSGPWTFDQDKKATYEEYKKWIFRQGVKLDTRGYIRLVDLDDCNCIESGQSRKIRFCPFCGDEFS